MRLVKWNKPSRTVPGMVSDLNNFFNDSLFNDRFLSNVMKEDWPVASAPSVNVKEDDKQFTVELAAPGLEKDSFNIDIDQNVMTVSASTKKEAEVNEEGYTRREFNFSSFKRSFTLPETVNDEKIDGKYENGVLYITLPKLSEAKAKRTINIK